MQEIGDAESQSPPEVQKYIESPAWVRRWPPPAAQVTEQAEPTGQKPPPDGHDWTAPWSETDGMFLGQPRVFLGMCGQVREAAFTAAIMLAAVGTRSVS